MKITVSTLSKKPQRNVHYGKNYFPSRIPVCAPTHDKIKNSVQGAFTETITSAWKKLAERRTTHTNTFYFYIFLAGFYRGALNE
jgi:hypothetical protein